MHTATKIAIFDFDQTIIDCNSDTYIDKLIDHSYATYPKEINSIKHWTYRMNSVFEYMFKKYNISKEHLIECLKEIKIDLKMIDLLKKLKKNSYEMIIVSDANTLFIQTILQANNLHDLFDHVYTNHVDTSLDEMNACLKLVPFNEVFYETSKQVFNCETKRCTDNMCKGEIVVNHLNGKNVCEKIVYVGDGPNDYCAGLRLGLNDHFFVRSNHRLHKILLENDALREKLKTNVFFWSCASEIVRELNF